MINPDGSITLTFPHRIDTRVTINPREFPFALYGHHQSYVINPHEPPDMRTRRWAFEDKGSFEDFKRYLLPEDIR